MFNQEVKLCKLVALSNLLTVCSILNLHVINHEIHPAKYLDS